MRGNDIQPIESLNQHQAIKDYVFKNIGQVFAVTISTIYLCGFIVVTAYLGRYGIREYEAFRIQYLIAGTILWICYGLLYYFVGQLVISTMHADDNSNKYEGWRVLDLLLPIANSLIVCTIVTGILLFGELFNNYASNIFLLAFMFGLIVLSNIGEFGLKQTNLSRILVRVFFTLAIIAYCISSDTIQFQLFLFYVLVTLVTILFITRFKAKGDKSDLYFIIYFILISGSGLFGSVTYRDVRSSVGGGAPIAVKLIFDNAKTISPEVARVLEIKNNTTSTVKLLAETDKELLLEYIYIKAKGNELIRIKKDIVQAIKIEQNK